MVRDILEQYVWPFHQACSNFLNLLNTQRIYGNNWTEPLESTMRIIIVLWRLQPTPQELFSQKSQPLLSLMKLFKMKKKRNLLHSQFELKSPCNGSFSWHSRSLWDLWFIISSYGWNRRRHLNLLYWRKTLMQFHANTL